MTTEERVRSAGWWPTQSTPQRGEYVGPAACAECHSSEAAAQQTTPMAKAGVAAADSKILAAHPRLTCRLGPYVYDLRHAEGGSVFSVTDGTRSVSTVLGWAFGEGEVGETYVFERGGDYYESHLSYFRALQALDITPGQSGYTPFDLEGALGRQMEVEEAQLCFGCHNTASSAGGKFDPDHLIPGITCEACHGPGAKHISAMKAGRTAEGLGDVLNPARLDPIDSVDFCGACHRAWADVMAGGMVGAATIRFQPSAWKPAGAGERVTPALPAWLATTRTSRWCTTRAPTIAAVSVATLQRRTHGATPAIPAQLARRARRTAPPVICLNMKSPAPTPNSQTTGFTSFDRINPKF